MARNINPYKESKFLSLLPFVRVSVCMCVSVSLCPPVCACVWAHMCVHVCVCLCVCDDTSGESGRSLVTMIQTVIQPVELFVQEQYSDALQQLEQLLQRQPANYTALAQLLTLLRRVGRVEEGEAHLHTAQDHVSRTAGTAGRPVGSKQCHQRQALLLTQNIVRVQVPWRMYLWVCYTTVLIRTEERPLVHESSPDEQ